MLNESLVCKPKTTANNSIVVTGDSFFYDGNIFQAFDYGHGEQISLNHDFLKALANHLESVALCGLHEKHEKLIEHCDAATMSHICEEFDGVILAGEATEWEFDNGKPVITRGCARTSSGDHKPKVFDSVSSGSSL